MVVEKLWIVCEYVVHCTHNSLDSSCYQELNESER